MLAPLPLYALLPFVAMLLAIALLPLAWPRWWEPNRNKLLVSAVLGLPVLLLYLLRGPAALVHTAGDYASFIILLAGLCMIAGGIQLRGDLEATPTVNTAFLGAGALLASLSAAGRGSAAWRPLRLWAPWLAMLLPLLALYFGWDTIQHRRETPAARRRDHALVEPLRLHGGSTPSGWPGWWPRWRCCTRPPARSPSWLSPGSRSGERPGRSAAPTSSPPTRWWRWRSSSSASSSP